MINYKKIANSILLTAVAFVFITLNFNFRFDTGGTLYIIDLLPTFLGYVILIPVLKTLGKEDPSTLVIKPLCTALIFLSFYSQTITAYLDFYFEATSYTQYNTFNLYFNIVKLAISVYFSYQLFTIIANICGRFSDETSKKIKTFRNIQVIFQIIARLSGLVNLFLIQSNLEFTLMYDIMQIFNYVFSAFSTALVIWCFVSLSRGYRVCKNAAMVLESQTLIQ